MVCHMVYDGGSYLISDNSSYSPVNTTTHSYSSPLPLLIPCPGPTTLIPSPTTPLPHPGIIFSLSAHLCCSVSTLNKTNPKQPLFAVYVHVMEERLKLESAISQYFKCLSAVSFCAAVFAEVEALYFIYGLEYEVFISCMLCASICT